MNYHSADHPLWALLRTLVFAGLAYGVLALTASELDWSEFKTEIGLIAIILVREFFPYASTVFENVADGAKKRQRTEAAPQRADDDMRGD